MDVGDGRKLVRRRLGRGDEAGDRLGRGREDEHPAREGVQVVQPELEARRDAEVAAAAADSPEEVRMSVGIDAQDPTVGDHHLCRQQRIDGQPVLPDEIPHAPTQRDPTEPHRACVPEPGGQAVDSHGRRVLSRREARLGPRRASLDIDL